jgi:hypothetical protein
MLVVIFAIVAICFLAVLFMTCIHDRQINE